MRGTTQEKNQFDGSRKVSVRAMAPYRKSPTYDQDVQSNHRTAPENQESISLSYERSSSHILQSATKGPPLVTQKDLRPASSLFEYQPSNPRLHQIAERPSLQRPLQQNVLQSHESRTKTTQCPMTPCPTIRHPNADAHVYPCTASQQIRTRMTETALLRQNKEIEIGHNEVRNHLRAAKNASTQFLTSHVKNRFSSPGIQTQNAARSNFNNEAQNLTTCINRRVVNQTSDNDAMNSTNRIDPQTHCTIPNEKRTKGNLSEGVLRHPDGFKKRRATVGGGSSIGSQKSTRELFNRAYAEFCGTEYDQSDPLSAAFVRDVNCLIRSVIYAPGKLEKGKLPQEKEKGKLTYREAKKGYSKLLRRVGDELVKDFDKLKWTEGRWAINGFIAEVFRRDRPRKGKL